MFCWNDFLGEKFGFCKIRISFMGKFQFCQKFLIFLFGKGKKNNQSDGSTAAWLEGPCRFCCRLQGESKIDNSLPGRQLGRCSRSGRGRRGGWVPWHSAGPAAQLPPQQPGQGEGEEEEDKEEEEEERQARGGQPAAACRPGSCGSPFSAGSWQAPRNSSLLPPEKKKDFGFSGKHFPRKK